MVPSKATHKGEPSVSIVVPAFDEAQNLAACIESIRKAVEDKAYEYEIIIINDGSRDDTGKVAETLAKQGSHIRVIHNPHNIGYGFAFMQGARAATYDYVQLVPGDNEIPTSSIETIASHLGTVDMVIPYLLNFRIRSLSRKIISWGYTAMLNVLFGLRLHYYNGPCAIRSDLIRTATVDTHGFAFMASILLQLIKQKYTFVEVGIILEPRHFGKSKLISPRNILSVVKTVAWLFWDINIARHFRRVCKPT